MHVELADLFRCPAHEGDGWLVVGAERTQQRVVLEGVLGCPTCGAEYPIRRGVTWFGQEIAQHGISIDAISDDDAMRAAALLGASDRNATLLFHGAPVALARAVQGVAAVRCIVIDAPDSDAALAAYALSDAPLAIVVSGDAAPLAASSVAGVWWSPPDDGRAPDDTVLRLLRARGRLISPAGHPLPRGFEELARDSRQWVAERSTDATAAPTGLTQLRRRR